MKPHLAVELQVSKETYSYGKRDLFILQKRPTNITKETYPYKTKETYIIAKETCCGGICVCVSVERDLFTLDIVKRDLFIWQKRPIL